MTTIAAGAPGGVTLLRPVLLALVLVLAGATAAGAIERRTPFQVEIRLLGGLLSFDLEGVMQERIDLEQRRYETRIHGRGRGVETVIESSGVLRDDRWAPLSTRLFVSLHGREWSSEAHHRPETGTVEYHSRGETFFLRRVYTADEVMTMPANVHVDDVVTALLNFAEGRWPHGSDGRYATLFIRRSRAARGGSGGPAYRARLRPVTLTVTQDAATRQATAVVDLRGLTTWAVAGRPARVLFDAEARPSEVHLSLKLGTSVRIRLQAATTAGAGGSGALPSAPDHRLVRGVVDGPKDRAAEAVALGGRRPGYRTKAASRAS